MTTTTAQAPAPLRQRILDLIDYAILGAWPAGDCTACARSTGTRCAPCTALWADVTRLDAAVTRVEDADSDAGALAVFLDLMAGLAGADMHTRAAARHAVDPAPLTPGQREFALGILHDAIRWTTPCDDEESRRRAAYENARDRIRTARNAAEIGIAMTGGAS